MMQRAEYLLLALMLAFPVTLHAQSPRDSVLAVVESLFTGMASRDAAALNRVFVADGYFQAIRDTATDADAPVTLREFTRRIGASQRTVVERMWDPQVLLDGPLAVVWTRYDFHRDRAFSHCGTDAFTLVRTAAGWRISGGAFTVQTRGCPPSPLGTLR
jgi:hypothetical protein